MRTSLYSILCIVVRLGAVMLFVETVTSFPAAWQALQVWTQTTSESDGAVRGMLIGFSGVAIALSFLLWLYPGLLARLAAGEASREVFESPVAPKELQFIAFSVLGVTFAIKGLIGLVTVLFRIALSAHLLGDVAFLALAWQNGLNLLVQVFQFGAGIGLTLGARGLTGLLHRLREHGLPPVRSDEDTGPPLS